MTPRMVREGAPLQVYLTAEEQQRLERIAANLDASKSDVVRRGLLALERELFNPAAHPALRLIGIAAAELGAAPAADAAREHDRLLADDEEASWRSTPRGASRRRVAESPTDVTKRRGR